MVHRRAQDGQADRDGDGPVEVERLGRDVPLVVVLRQDAVVPAGEAVVEHRVGGDGAGHVQPERLRVGHGGREVDDLLVAESAVLPAVRVDRGHGEPWRGHAEDLERLCGPPDRAELRLARDLVERLAQRQVPGGEEDAQVVVGLVRVAHHEHGVLLGDAGEGAEHLGVPEVLAARRPDGLLVDGSGDHAADRAVQRGPGRRLDGDDGGAAGAGVHLSPGGHVGAEHPDVEDVDDAGTRRLRVPRAHGPQLDVETERDTCPVEHGQVADGDAVVRRVAGVLGQRGERDLGADADGVADGECEHGSCHGVLS